MRFSSSNSPASWVFPCSHPACPSPPCAASVTESSPLGLALQALYNVAKPCPTQGQPSGPQMSIYLGESGPSPCQLAHLPPPPDASCSCSPRLDALPGDSPLPAIFWILIWPHSLQELPPASVPTQLSSLPVGNTQIHLALIISISVPQGTVLAPRTGGYSGYSPLLPTVLGSEQTPPQGALAQVLSVFSRRCGFQGNWTPNA